MRVERSLPDVVDPEELEDHVLRDVEAFGPAIVELIALRSVGGEGHRTVQPAEVAALIVVLVLRTQVQRVDVGPAGDGLQQLGDQVEPRGRAVLAARPIESSLGVEDGVVKRRQRAHHSHASKCSYSERSSRIIWTVLAGTSQMTSPVTSKSPANVP